MRRLVDQILRKRSGGNGNVPATFERLWEKGAALSGVQPTDRAHRCRRKGHPFLPSLSATLIQSLPFNHSGIEPTAKKSPLSFDSHMLWVRRGRPYVGSNHAYPGSGRQL